MIKKLEVHERRGKESLSGKIDSLCVNLSLFVKKAKHCTDITEILLSYVVKR